MKAAVFYEYNAPLIVEEIQIDAPKRTEVLVKIAASGVCHSDLSHINGTLPFPAPPAVLGHEGAGIVEEVGADVTGINPGDDDNSHVLPLARENLNGLLLRLSSAKR